MKTQQQIRESVLGSIKRGELHRRIMNFLLKEGFDETKAEEFIKVVKEQYRLEKLKELPKKNKIAFAISSVFFLFSICLFFYIIPHTFIFFRTFFSIIGSLFISLSAYYTLFYFNSWKEKNLNPNGDFIYFNLLLPLMVVPGIILFFVLSWNFDRIKDNILLETKIETSGKILDGSSITSRKGLDFSDVYVVFYTKEGEKIKANYETDRFEFNRMFQGQIVRLVYSSKNPQHFKLLTTEENIKKFGSKADRTILVKDLIQLLSTLNKDVTQSLNEISFGWDFSSEKECWENKNQDLLISKSPDQIMFLSGKQFDIQYVNEFKSLGFNKIESIGNNLYGIYESETMVAELKRINIKGEIANVLILARKKK